MVFYFCCYDSKLKKNEPKIKKDKKIINKQQQEIKQELEKKVAIIRKKKKTEKADQKKSKPLKSIEKLKIGDRVRMMDGIITEITNTIKKDDFRIFF